jgi:hypothetical protein
MVLGPYSTLLLSPCKDLNSVIINQNAEVCHGTSL